VSTASATLVLPGQTSSNAAGACGYVATGDPAPVPGCTGFQWSSQQMVNDVQAWLNGTMQNDGWEVINTTGPFRQFYTNAGTPEGWQPALTVDYTLASPVPEPATLSMAGIGLLSFAAKFRNRFARSSK
jgi:hypothetical protein